VWPNNAANALAIAASFILESVRNAPRAGKYIFDGQSDLQELRT